MTREDQAIITVRYYVGEDRERSLVKLYKKMDENLDVIPPGVTGWVVKPVEIDDVPIVTLTLTGTEGDSYTLRRVGEEVVQRLSALPGVSRAYVVGGEPRTVRIDLDPERLRPTRWARWRSSAPFKEPMSRIRPATSHATTRSSGSRGAWPSTGPNNCENSWSASLTNRPVFLKDVATVSDGPDEVTSYVRHGWGPARGFEAPEGFPGTEVGEHVEATGSETPRPAVTLRSCQEEGDQRGLGGRVGAEIRRGASERGHPRRHGAGHHPQLRD